MCMDGDGRTRCPAHTTAGTPTQPTALALCVCVCVCVCGHCSTCLSGATLPLPTPSYVVVRPASSSVAAPRCRHLAGATRTSPSQRSVRLLSAPRRQSFSSLRSRDPASQACAVALPCALPGSHESRKPWLCCAGVDLTCRFSVAVFALSCSYGASFAFRRRSASSLSPPLFAP